MSSAPERTDLLVLGASFAGIEVVLQIQRRLSKPLKITVVDRQRSHGYIPLVHERLCGVLTDEQSILPTEDFVRSLPGTDFVCDEVVSFDPERKVVELGSGRRIAARFVVVALGSVVTPPPGMPGAEHMLGHKFEAEIDEARPRLAETLGSEGDASAEPRMVVVGGGISGVELAGELALLRRRRPEGWRAPAVTLVSAGARLLPELAAGVGRKAASALVGQGVDLRLETRLVEAGPSSVQLRHEETVESLDAALTFWAGGIRPAPILEHLGLPRTDDGWLAVGPTLQCFPTPEPTHPEIFACGDAVRVVGGDGVWPTMQRAIECLWQAKVVARNVAILAEHAPKNRGEVPVLRPHVLRPRFAYGVSLGGRSLVVYGALKIDFPAINVWFRRWLMRQYFARYSPRVG
ncbi:MAG: FAD-dependent oxidoreductase [Myxococcota bacterium]